MKPMRTLIALSAALLLLVACGNGDDDDDSLTIESDADGIIADDGDLESDDFEGVDDTGSGDDGPAYLEVEPDEVAAVTRELFDDRGHGRSTGTSGDRSYFRVTINVDELSDAELVAGCEGMTDFIYDLPEEQASGPVDIFISLDMTVGDDAEHFIVNDGLIPREARGSCELQ